MQYIATFYTHSGAIKYSRFLTQKEIENEKMPVPRKISSNCGIGVTFNYEGPHEEIYSDDMEKLFYIKQKDYILVKDF